MSDSSNLVLLALAFGATAYVVMNWDKLQKSKSVDDRPIPQNPPLDRPIEMSSSRNNPMMPPANAPAAPINRDYLPGVVWSGKTFLG